MIAQPAKQIGVEVSSRGHRDRSRQHFIPQMRRKADQPIIGASAMSEGSIASQHQTGVVARWAGPVNIRGMLADLPVHERSLASDLIKKDKYVYAILLNMAIRANGRKTRGAIVSETSFALRCPIDATVASRLFDLLLESGWLVEDFNDQS